MVWLKCPLLHSKTCTAANCTRRQTINTHATCSNANGSGGGPTEPAMKPGRTCSITSRCSITRHASTPAMECYRPSSSRNGTKSNPEGVYRTRGYSKRSISLSWAGVALHIRSPRCRDANPTLTVMVCLDMFVAELKSSSPFSAAQKPAGLMDFRNVLSNNSRSHIAATTACFATALANRSKLRHRGL